MEYFQCCGMICRSHCVLRAPTVGVIGVGTAFLLSSPRDALTSVVDFTVRYISLNAFRSTNQSINQSVNQSINQ